MVLREVFLKPLLLTEFLLTAGLETGERPDEKMCTLNVLFQGVFLFRSVIPLKAVLIHSETNFGDSGYCGPS